jgi:methylated-DNA-[protein]-cysteine S-methyltransferase
MAHLGGHSVTIETKLGPLHVTFTQRGMAALEFCRAGRRFALPQPRGDGSLSNNLARQLQDYAAGKPVRFRCRLDLTSGTAFQQEVWRTLLMIPRGQTRSYGWVARRLGRPGTSRAVGAACRANPVPIIVPCHRVIASDGSLGGFSGGLALKKRLLKLERATF